MKQGLVVTLALLALYVPMARGAELRVLSAGAIEPALVGLADTFRRDAGHRVEVSFATAPALRRKVTAGESADILIAAARRH